jgi:hypothetical protein
MAIGDLKDILHKIKVKLYPNYFLNAEGAYIARTDNEATLSVEDVCTTLKNRGGFQGKYDELVDNVHQFFDELAYQLCDGYAVSTGYFSIHPGKAKATRIAENTANKIIGIIPSTPGSPLKLEIYTQFTGSGDKFLKTPRVITSGFVLSE